MPQLGETVTEGTITKWLKNVGDEIALDDALFEVSTDKVDTEVPSAHAGVLRQILVPEGDTVPIGTPLAVIADTADEAVADRPAPSAPPAPPPQSPPPPRSALAPPAAGEVGRVGARKGAQAPNFRQDRRENGFLSPVVRALLSEHGLAPDDVVGTGRDGRITRA